MKWKRLYQEQTTPSDEKSIMASFEKDVSDQKFSPTTEFLEVAYGIFNDRFFGGQLPQGILFKVKVQSTKSYIGQASYMYDRLRNRIWTTGITLNGSRTLTLHEWLEVVLHEMIHVLDYETNPHHFLGYGRRSYDSHGYWFMEQGEKYAKYGFHVQKFCKADVGINTSDAKIQSRISNSVFLCMTAKADSRPMIMKVSRKNLDRTLDYITSRIGDDGFARGVEEILVMTSENPRISALREMRMKNRYSRIFWWWATDDFKAKYGPFELEDTIKVLSAANRVDEEDSDKPMEVDDETAEEVIDEIYDNVEGVADVKEVGDDKFVVSIP